ncbi:MAG: PLP-dependent transferase [Planctomycetes bacterium]|nr:PLP-dependent transferase [Planctomycetota bacterium]
MPSHDDRPMALSTRCIHGGQHPDPSTGAVMPPISLASTYAQTSPGAHQGYAYARGQNPTRYALERCVASLEESPLTEDDDLTQGGFAFASGLAATAVALELLDAGDHVVASDDLYGGTFRLMTGVRGASQNLGVTYVDTTDTGRVAEAITDRTRMIWVETPSNPLLKLADLDAIAEIGSRREILTICDNTFATPMLQRPLSHGFDITMHSATKYLGGHSDVIAGILVTRRLDLAQRLRFLQNAVGAILGPFEAYMTLRGIKTLAIRMRQHCRSAARIAEWLNAHPKVERVAFPGIDGDPQRELAHRQMRLDCSPAGGGMITMWLSGGLDEARRFLESVRVFTLAESLGGVESLIEHPAIMTHSSVPPDARAALGISDSLIRVSVGIEDTDDLIADLDSALAAV